MRGRDRDGDREGAGGTPQDRGEHSGAAPGAQGSVRGPCPAPSQVRPQALGHPGRAAPLPARWCRCSGICPRGPFLLHHRCSQRHPLPARLWVPSEPLGLTTALLRVPFRVKQPPLLARRGPSTGSALEWQLLAPAERGFPSMSPGSLPVPLLAPCAPAGISSQGGEGQGSAHASSQAFAPSFSGVKRAGSFSAWFFSITSIPLGDAGMRWRSGWPLSDWTSKSFPSAF